MQSAHRKQILDVLTSERTLNVPELASELDANPVDIDLQCYRLEQCGYVFLVGNGVYALTEDGEEYIETKYRA